MPLAFQRPEQQPDLGDRARRFPGAALAELAVSPAPVGRELGPGVSACLALPQPALPGLSRALQTEEELPQLRARSWPS